MFSYYMKKQSARRLRRKLKAWKRLTASRNPFAAVELAREIETTSLDIDHAKLAALEPDIDPETITTHLVQRLCVATLLESILPSLSLTITGFSTPLGVALPPAWRRRLEEFGVPIARGPSRLLWTMKLWRMWVGGIARGAKLILHAWWNRDSPPSRPYVVICVPNTRMVAGKPSAQNYDFLTTFLRSGVCATNDRDIWIFLNRKPARAIPGITFASNFFPSLGSWRRKLTFTGQALRIVFSDLAGIARGQWWRAILQDERIQLCYARFLSHNEIAASYVFTSAGLLIRPLWTYHVEKAGAQVVMTFISTNFFNLSPITGGKTPINVGFHSLSWNTYAVWGRSQQKLLMSAGHTNAEFIQMGPVGFVEDPDNSVSLPSNCIVIFDVAPLRHAKLADMGYPNPYIDLSAQRMIEDIVARAHSLGFNVALKQKPKPDRSVDGRYRSFLADIVANGELMVIPTGISPHRLIEQAVGVISAPFTSTAFVARALDKPSVFYDPLNVLQNARENADGIPVLCGRDELFGWLSDLATRPFPEKTTNAPLPVDTTDSVIRSIVGTSSRTSALK